MERKAIGITGNPTRKGSYIERHREPAYIPEMQRIAVGTTPRSGKRPIVIESAERPESGRVSYDTAPLMSDKDQKLLIACLLEILGGNVEIQPEQIERLRSCEAEPVVSDSAYGMSFYRPRGVQVSLRCGKESRGCLDPNKMNGACDQ